MKTLGATTPTRATVLRMGTRWAACLYSTCYFANRVGPRSPPLPILPRDLRDAGLPSFVVSWISA